MTWEGLSDEMLQFRRHPMAFLAVVCHCVWMLRHCPTLVSFVHLGLWCNDGSLIIGLTQLLNFWKLSTIGIILIGTNGRVSTFHCAR